MFKQIVGCLLAALGLLFFCAPANAVTIEAGWQATFEFSGLDPSSRYWIYADSAPIAPCTLFFCDQLSYTTTAAVDLSLYGGNSLATDRVYSGILSGLLPTGISDLSMTIRILSGTLDVLPYLYLDDTPPHVRVDGTLASLEAVPLPPALPLLLTALAGLLFFGRRRRLSLA